MFYFECVLLFILRKLLRRVTFGGALRDIPKDYASLKLDYVCDALFCPGNTSENVCFAPEIVYQPDFQKAHVMLESCKERLALPFRMMAGHSTIN